jgi:Bax protein
MILVPDLLRHPRLPLLARVALVAVLAAFTFTAFAQYRQFGSVLDEMQIGLTEILDDIVVDEHIFVSELPDFESFGDIDARKSAFFEFLTAFVEAENQRIALMRAELLPMSEVVRSGQPLSAFEAERLAAIAAEYRLAESGLDQRALVRELVRRVDELPVSLVLAQAANESAWGTSRFAREGNNIFGQWCFDEGCGLIPSRRGKGATHEVRAFASIEASVRAYFRNLNTNRSYEDLRELRAAMRMQDLALDAMVLARGLTRYSERGLAYVNELQNIIRVNRLLELDQNT